MTGSPATAAAPASHALMPNLFIIGASKAGSSALHAYLGYHPDIRMSDVKEPCYFVDPAELRAAWPIIARDPVSHDRDAYLALFRGGETAAWRGEASVYYSQSPHRSGVPERIAAAAPDARILYLVREPVARTIAHYWQRRKEFQEPLDLAEAVDRQPLYRDTSDYALQLARYLDVFPRRRIHVVVAEELRARRTEVLGEIFDWLGLPPFAYDADQLAERHRSPATSRAPRFPLVRQLRDSAAWARARQALPVSAVDGLRRFATRAYNKAATDDSAVRSDLATWFAPRIDAFEAMIGRRIDAWTDVRR